MGLLWKHYSADGATQITGISLAKAYAGATQTAKKFYLQNVGDRASDPEELRIGEVSGNDGSPMIRIGLDVDSVMPPFGLAAVLGATAQGGVWGATGLVYWVVVAVNATGETVASLEVSVNVDDTTKKVTLDWEQSPGATGYKVFRTTDPGVYGASSRRATLSGIGSTTYVDDGDALASGTPLTENTTGGAAPTYGTPPTLGTAALVLGEIAIGQWVCYWLNRVVPAATPELGNPRQALLQFVET